MDQKLTLKFNAQVIASTKDFADGAGVSLSHLVENYFRSLLESKASKSTKIHPLVKELSGSAALSGKGDERSRYLLKKYSP